DKTVRLWEVNRGQELVSLRAHADAVNAIAYSPDGTRLASASDDRTIVVWHAARGERQELLAAHSLREHTGPVLAVAFSPDGKRVASAGDDRTGRLWD